MKEKEKIIGTNMFESMEFLANRAWKDMMSVMTEQQKNVENWLGVSTDFGKDVKDILEETNQGYEKLMEIWTELGDMADEAGITEEKFGKTIHQEFIEYNQKVNQQLEKMVEESFENYRQLYSSWTSLNESFLKGIKAGTGPNPEEIMDAFADFQQTAIHVALRGLDDNREDMNTLKDTLGDFSERTAKRFAEATEAGNRKYAEYITGWQDKVKEMETRVNEQLKMFEKRYRSTMKPYFMRPVIMPFFPWLPGRRMREYEHDIEEMKEKIKELEKKQEEKD